MEPIGMGATRAVIRKEMDSRVLQLRALALPAKKEADGLPVRFDRDVDMEIPRRLICWRADNGLSVELRREMRPDERASVEARSAALELALQPFQFEQSAEVNASISAMLAGFRSMRQQGQAVEDVVLIIRAVLREFPAWAITKGCLRIARHETKTDPRFAPNDAEITDVVRDVVKLYRQAFAETATLLSAVVQSGEAKQRGSTREAQQPPPHPVGDGKHGARVAAELARRAQERAAAEETK